MNSHPKLTSDQIRSFSTDGYLIVRGLYDSDVMKAVSDWTDELVAMPEDPDSHWVYWERDLRGKQDPVLCRIEKFLEVSDGFRDLNDGITDMVSQLVGERSVLFKEKINFKQPGGDGFKPHQDSQAGWERYAGFFVSVLVSIDKATVENGCLEIASGYNKEGLLHREWEPFTDEEIEHMNMTPVPTEPGDVIFFDSYAPHGSKPNLSDRQRRILYLTYNKASEGDHREQYYVDKFASYPPDIARSADQEYVFRV
jgi:hypothetical protein